MICHDMARAADAGDLSAQRAMVAYFASAAPLADDPIDCLNGTISYARMAAAQGSRDDILALVTILFVRAGYDGAAWAGGEAIAIIDASANVGDEDAAASLQVLMDGLPSDTAKAFIDAAQQNHARR